MKLMAKSFLSFFLAAWILLGSLGISWTEATCVYTGAKKTALSKAESCCKNSVQAHISRAKCCLLEKYQVKFNFNLTKGNAAIQFAFVPFLGQNLIYFERNFYQELGSFRSFQANAPPLSRQVRLAQLQSYLI
ncbi:MAG: hypothetical protein RL045_1819 [Bacteroidota bacterium]|jgi:hypothetical protein